MSKACAIGFDIGGTNIRAARISQSGDILEWLAQPTEGQPELVVEQIAGLVRLLNDGSVKAIGIGLPGRVNVQNNHMLSGGYVDLTGVPLASALASH